MKVIVLEEKSIQSKMFIFNTTITFTSAFLINKAFLRYFLVNNGILFCTVALKKVWPQNHAVKD